MISKASWAASQSARISPSTRASSIRRSTKATQPDCAATIASCTGPSRASNSAMAA